MENIINSASPTQYATILLSPTQAVTKSLPHTKNPPVTILTIIVWNLEIFKNRLFTPSLSSLTANLFILGIKTELTDAANSLK